MKKLFVRTTNYEAFQEGLTVIENRGAAEASMMLVTGEAGYGKSETVDQWAIQVGAAYLRAKIEWTPRYFMSELAENLKLDSRGRAKEVFARIAGFIGSRQIPLVIDEAEHCLKNNAEVLEAIRDLSDLTEVTVVLVGMEQIQNKIARFAQISSRIAHIVTFNPSTVSDVMLVCKQLCEVEVAPDLCVEIQRQSKGRMREIMNAIALVERIGTRNNLSVVTLNDMDNMPLTNDWQSRRPRLVKAGVR